MGSFASINGSITPAAEARVSVLDNGFTFGDAVYETLRTYGGRPFELGRHLRRLRASAGRLGFAIPADDAELERRLADLLERAGNPESYIRMIVSRGVGDISYNFERVSAPTVVLVVKPLEPCPASLFERGLDVAVVSVRRNSPHALDPAIKSCNLLNNVLAVREAQGRKADEAILLNERGEVAEGASTNVFVVKGGALRTPPLAAGILAGITREVLLGLFAEMKVAVDDRPLPLAELLSADEAFLTGTVREVMPIRSIDGQPVGSGGPGAVTRRVMEAFRAYAHRPAVLTA
jgi:branched-chain amino acid aminotransferase